MKYEMSGCDLENFCPDPSTVSVCQSLWHAFIHDFPMALLLFLSLFPPFQKVSELSVIIDSAFLFDVPGFAAPFLEYLQQDSSAAYGSYCAEVGTAVCWGLSCGALIHSA